MPKNNTDLSKFNTSQQLAINSRHKSTLVSASAGTGKTTVMIERLFQMIKQDNVDLSQVVVVTFTKLAANQMKEKLTGKLMKERDNPAVLQQLEKIDNCIISTLHSFCGNLLRNYFYVVDIDPNYTMLDDYSLKNLKIQCLKKVLEDYYQSDDQVFDNLYKIYSANRNDELLIEEIVKLHDKSCSFVDFYDWYKHVRENGLHFEGSPLEQQFNAFLISTLIYIRNQWLDCADVGKLNGLNFYVNICQENADLFSVAPTNTFRQNYQLVKQIVGNVKGLPNRRSKEWKVVDDNTKETLIDMFSAIKEECQKSIKVYVDFDSDVTFDQLVEQSAQMTEYADKFVEVLQRFDNVFAQTKRQSGVVDFSDLEHFALKILNDEHCLAEIQAQYKYVFVDEHQDTNPLQAAIINKLVGNNRLFLVGDVKQSIYGFRGCTPNNFADSSKDFQQDATCEYVELNQNYRSDDKILNFVNTVMSGVMTEDFGKINYEQTSLFKAFRKLKGKSELQPVLIDVISKPKAENKQAEAEQQIYNIDQPISDTFDKVRAEGLAIAHRIQQLVGSTYVDESGDVPVSKTIGYSDIAILSRSKGDYAINLYNVLLEKNIPVVGSFSMKGLKNKEVRLLVSLLRVIDNPHNDVAFVGVLLSHLGNLSEQQLAHVKISTGYEKQSFYLRATAYAQSHDDEIAQKLNSVLTQIETYRLFSYGATVDQLLLEVVASTNYHLHVSGLPNASLRVKKMYEFIDQIKDKHYSQSIDKFLQFLDETAFEDELDDDSSQISAVKFMTMHASKGLEFPVVFIVGATRHFKADTDTAVYDADFGITFNYYDFDNRIKSNSLVATATRFLKQKANLAEELRLLYVALTRAQKYLIITLPEDNYANELAGKKPLNAVNCYAPWLLTAVGKHVKKFADGQYNNGIMVSFLDESKYQEDGAKEQQLLATQSQDLDQALSKLAYVYPYTHQIVPSKLASSTLDAHYFDLKEGQQEGNVTWQPLASDDIRMLLGTAYHKVYETINYDADASQIATHLQTLVNQRLIDEQIAAKIDINLIYQTLSNPTFKQIVSSGKVYHEVPFLTQTEYSRFVEDGSDASTLLQGIIDLLVVGNDKAIIVDFKYTSNSYKLEERYTKQLQSYRFAVEKILNLPVDSYLLSIADNKLIKLN